MTAGTLIRRSLVYFRAPHAALLAGMMLVTAVLTGALILGDSVRDSLRDLSARRRGGYETLVMAPGFFSHGLAERAGDISGRPCDAGLALPGRVRAERTTLSMGVQLLALQKAAGVAQNGAWITRTVAESLQLKNGDALLLTLPAPTGAADAVLARRDRTSLASLRVTVQKILDERSTEAWPPPLLAWFDLHPSQRPPANVWLNMPDLQAALQADIPPDNRIPKSPANFLLVGSWAGGSVKLDVTILPPPQAQFPPPQAQFPPPQAQFPPPQALTLEDYGLGLARSGDDVILRSGTLYIPPQIARTLHPYKATGLEIYTLLLDRVLTDNAQASALNYVMAAGITGHGDLSLKDNQAAVNQWTAEQLHVKIGDTLHVSPYRVAGDTVAPGPASTFTVAYILPMSGLGADPTLTPAFHGLTDADTIAKWDPPAGFPFDRTRVTPADEAYWDAHKASPKIFFNLIAAQRLVKPATTLTSVGNSAGELTSLRLPVPQPQRLSDDPAMDYERELLTKLSPAAAGFTSRPFAPDQPASTDFASLFLGLSGFLLIAALLLVVLLFRLAVEQRARQMGLLGALGFTPRRIGRLILAEGALVALLGALAGLPLAIGYTRLLIGGLGSWWIGATGTQAITLYLHLPTLALGSAASLLAALLALAFTTWRISRWTPIAQLTNHPTPISKSKSPITNYQLPITLAALLLALTPILLSPFNLLPAPLAFLLSGFLLLTLAILILARLPAASRRVRHTLLAVAAAGILRQRTRAVLCVALMASASFLLTSVTAFQSVPTAPTAPPSPTGGYQLIITTQIPLPADPQTPAGRKLLGLPDDPLLASATFTSLLVQPGDDISCLNMTRPTSATLVGAPAAVLERLAVTQRGPAPQGDAIPAAVDQQTAQYILHTSLGQPLPAANVTRPIVITRLLADSIFQSYALIPEDDFRQAFPAVTRSSLILVDCPPAAVPQLQTILRASLDDFGVTVETTTQRLAAYHAVADSYIAAFQFLGGLALLVGALGLVVVLARNVIQRRAELALLQALGFPRPRITLMLVLEHGLLLLTGLTLGVLTALLATAPQIRQVHLLPVAVAAGIILATGLLVLTTTARLAMRQLTPAALRQE